MQSQVDSGLQTNTLKMMQFNRGLLLVVPQQLLENSSGINGG